ncbi:unnamed protein product [Hermetia illucens]|uniref:BED-type domain-containing protein n=2 Tax=Hermetia illucens TaxID=343691 RepID=A0A7R8Z184_HERIL|nr:unnamed protein product [Hermetia illucens]
MALAPKSEVWKFYVRINDKIAKCNVCGNNIKTSGNTTNLRCHIKTKHKNIFEEHFNRSNQNNTRVASSLETPSEVAIEIGNKSTSSTSTSLTASSSRASTLSPSPSIASTSSGSTCISVSNYKQYGSLNQSFANISSFQEGGNKNSKITDGILFMICRDSEPISVVENEGFQYLMKLVAPLYKIPSRRTFDELLDKKYEFVSNMLKEKLSGIQYICLTTDVWTETHQTRSFLGVTAHYVSNDTDDLKLQGVTLGVYELEERHTGENLAQKLKEICTKWNIKDDVVIAVVTDGGSNMIKAVELAFDKKRHTYCFAHLLNLLAQKSIESLPQLKSLLEQVKTIVSWFRSSVIGSDELRKRTVNSTEKTLIQSVSTRWNSTYYMVERFLALREIVSSIINFNTTAPPMITAKDVEFLQDFVLLFKPIEVATKEACGEKFVTSSMIIPIVRLLRKKISEASITTDLAKSLKNNIFAEWNKRFLNIEQNQLFATATILDPRFKNLHFDDKAALGSVIWKLSNELRKDLIESESDSDAPSHSSGSKENEYSLWDDHHKMVQEAWKSRKKSRIVEELDTPNSIPPEFSVYLKQPVVRLKDSPIEVWTEIVHKDSSLLKMVKKYLCVMATSVPCERVFSASGNIANCKRSCLLGEKLHKLLFLKSVDKTFWGHN